WMGDLRSAIELLSERQDVGGVWLAGSSAGGALAICVAADDPRVRGVVTLAAPASFADWAASPARLLEYSREIGMIRHAGFPADPVAWGKHFTEVSPLECAARLGPRPLLLIHGDQDEVVPLSDSRALYEAAYESADLRVVAGGGHRLRHDPRAVALLIGWLARQSP
ncbi:MAG: alpha/beta hydrolase, partial [Acidimicrobiia bacterium]